MTNLENTEKRWQTARARLCLKGITAVRVEGDDGLPMYVACMGAWTKFVDSLVDLERFVLTVEGGVAHE